MSWPPNDPHAQPRVPEQPPYPEHPQYPEHPHYSEYPEYPQYSVHPEQGVYDPQQHWSAAHDPRAQADAVTEEPKKKFWSRTGVILTTVISVIGAITGIISIWPILTRDASNFSHLVMAAEPVADGRTDWAIPVDALDGEFPVDGSACGTQQLEWFRAHAQPLQRRFMLTVRNTATEGAMLALTDFRASEDAQGDRGTVMIRAVCDPTGSLPSSMYYARLDADRSDTTARHVEVEAGAPAEAAPQIPLGYNLAPGESGKISLELFSRQPAAGTVTVSVLSGTEEREETIEGIDYDMPALLFGGDMFLVTTAEGWQCLRTDADRLIPCTLDELRNEHAAIPGS